MYSIKGDNMENKTKKKNNRLQLILRIVAAVIFVVGLIFTFVEIGDDYNHDLEIEVGIANPSDEFYQISLEGELDNHTKKIVSGTLNVKLKDSKGRVATATFDNITIFPKKEVEIDTINNSVVTNLFDGKNGLNYDIRIVEVTVGDVEFLEYSPLLEVAIPLMIVGVAMLLVEEIVFQRIKKKTTDIEVEEN